MNRRDLLEKELNTFMREVKKVYPPDKIILFGSLAFGKVTDTSDLDVVVVAKTRDNFWTRLENVAKCCSHKVGMDVLVYTPEEFGKLSDSRTFFQKEIQEKGKVIYEAPSA